MNILFSADLHFTDLARDDYRWGLLPWLAKQVEKHEVDMVVLGGDITDQKDRHSAVLVNKLVNGLGPIADLAEVVILRGNHDYIDENQPFFGFLDAVKARHIITFVVEPLATSKFLFLPNTKNWQEEWKDFKFANYDLIFTHATFDGCTSESGYTLPGIPPSFFKGAKKVWSGDIHKPQVVGKNIEYVGAPYRIRFGDVFVPRVVLLKDGKAQDLHYSCQQKHLIEIDDPRSAASAKADFELVGETGGVTIHSGDQVKVRVRLRRGAYPEWPAIKAALIESAQADKLELTGPELVALEEAPKGCESSRESRQDEASPLRALAAYAEEKDVSEALRKAGTAFLKQALGGGK